MSIVDWRTDSFVHTGVFYAYAAFSRAVRGGKYALELSAAHRSPDLVVNQDALNYGVPIWAASFGNDTHITVVLMNDQQSSCDNFRVAVDEYISSAIDLPPVSIVLVEFPLAGVPPPPPSADAGTPAWVAPVAAVLSVLVVAVAAVVAYRWWQRRKEGQIQAQQTRGGEAAAAGYAELNNGGYNALM